MTHNKIISDNPSHFSERIIIRIDPQLKKILYQEMKEKKITKISTYIRQIINKRNTKTTRITAVNTDENCGPGKKEYRELLTEYNKVLQKFKDISKIKNEDGNPIINEKILYETVKSLNDRTENLATVFKRLLNDNQTS